MLRTNLCADEDFLALSSVHGSLHGSIVSSPHPRHGQVANLSFMGLLALLCGCPPRLVGPRFYRQKASRNATVV